ncbi:MAG: queuosine precursor transporter [Prolixibacteraceae bacterium]
MQNKVSVLFLVAGILFAACMLIANILASKIIMIGPWAAPAGVVVFPLAYIINDVIVEVWGYGSARLIIWAGFGVNILAALFYMIGIALPSAPFYEGQEAFRMILGSSVRIVIASLIAYLAGSFLNAFVMSRFKLMTNGRNFSLRAIVSTVAGEGADSVIFISIAFAGIFPLKMILTMIVSQALLKIAYEIVVLPVTVLVVNKVKSLEGEDVFDRGVSYNPFRIKQI